MMDDALLEIILGRLDKVGLGKEATDVLLGACEGDEALAQVLGGMPPPRPTRVADADVAEAAGAYLSSITLRGFRGIGQQTCLSLQPGPGLTLVVGRNGSGKSSFAKGLEALFTGAVRRWADHSAVWGEGWRNLHVPEQVDISAELAIQGAGTATVRRHWEPGAPLSNSQVSVQVAGEKRTGMERLGWDEALVTYRPFLSHSELEAFFGKPSQLYDLLATVLGLDELTETAKRLAGARKGAEAPLDAAKKDLVGLRERLGALDDERATACAAALSKKIWDLDAALALATGAVAGPGGDLERLRALCRLELPNEDEVLAVVGELGSAAQALVAVAGTKTARARSLAGILQAALTHHGLHHDMDCPVCGRSGALDAEWRRAAELEVARLRSEAEAADRAHRRAEQARARVRALVAAVPQALVRGTPAALEVSPALVAWQAWAQVPDETAADDLEVLAEHLLAAWAPLVDAVGALVARSGAILAESEDRWAPTAAAVSAWCAAAAEALIRSILVPALKAAETWLKGATDDIRNARLAPLADEARLIWAQLRQESNVGLGVLRLAGSFTQRHLELDVSAGVLSERPLGEAGKEQPAVEHVGPDVEAGGCRAEHRGDEGPGEHDAQLVHDRADHLRLSSRAHALVRVPEALEGGVLQVAGQP